MNDLHYKQQYLVTLINVAIRYKSIFVDIHMKVLYGSYNAIKQTVAGHNNHCTIHTIQINMTE